MNREGLAPPAYRLALGTVQFGMPYGITNRKGQISIDEAALIVDHAWAKGLDTLDTAVAYGQSEQRLGEVGVGNWKVVSKLPAISDSHADAAAWVQEALLGSLRRLGVQKLHALLLHHSEQLLGTRGGAIYSALQAAKDQGMVEKIGVSVYGAHELDAVWEHFALDIVQAPFSIFDRRLATSGWLARLNRAGTEVHVRSIFLQGLLLADAENRPKTFDRWMPLWDRWHRWLDEESLTALQACLGFAVSQPGIDRVIIGVDSLRQLQEILDNVSTPAVDPPSLLMSEDEDLINPTRWSSV